MDNEKGKLEVDILEEEKLKNWFFRERLVVDFLGSEQGRSSFGSNGNFPAFEFWKIPHRRYSFLWDAEQFVYYFDLEQGNSEVHLSIDPTGNILQWSDLSGRWRLIYKVCKVYEVRRIRWLYKLYRLYNSEFNWNKGPLYACVCVCVYVCKKCISRIYRVKYHKECMNRFHLIRR